MTANEFILKDYWIGLNDIIKDCEMGGNNLRFILLKLKKRPHQPIMQQADLGVVPGCPIETKKSLGTQVDNHLLDWNEWYNIRLRNGRKQF